MAKTCLNNKGDGCDFAIGMKSSFKPMVASPFSYALCAHDFARHILEVQAIDMASSFIFQHLMGNFNNRTSGISSF